MDIRAEGTYPGTDMRLTLATIAGEASPSFFFPVLPERGYEASPVGRMTALLPDMVWGYGIRTFTCGAHETRFHRSACSLLEQDLDLLEETIETTGTAEGKLTVPLAGPVTCLSHVELSNGHWMWTDAGAVRDLMEQYAEMVAHVINEITHRTGRDVWIVIDETEAQSVFDGSLSGIHIWESMPIPDMRTLLSQWGASGAVAPGRVVLRLPDMTQFPDHTWTRYCDSVIRAKTLHLALPFSLRPTAEQRDTLGELYDQWGTSLELYRYQWRCHASSGALRHSALHKCYTI